ncbi:MMPL family transporter [Streptomyces lycii]|uniref:MMPL family transporter n=1 Tax=Streptomyces lycii TaxID=2654337 RepID=A0ABQ7FCX3_9ACTN|nr:MMPL family transporter [Streptomyces lycii]KAF4406368.1 MMPL family transporter [Streptomyces lycii]
MFDRIAELALRRARLVLTLTVVAVVAMAALGFGAFGKLLSGGFDDPASPSSRAQALIEKEFGGESNLLLLVRAEDGGLGSPAAERAGRQLTGELAGEPGVSRVVSHWDSGGPALLSEDGASALVAAHVEGDDTAVGDRTAQLKERYTGDRGAVSVLAGGPAAVGDDVSTQVAKDLAVAEAIAVPVTLVLLVLAFGSVLAALLPLVIGVIAVFGTFAELFVLGSLTEVSVFAINLTTALGLGLGIDYALLLVSRFREQLAAGAEVPDALRVTVRTAGRTIAFSAATVIAALAALLVFPPFFLRSFAYAGIGVVAIAAVSALLVVPALLAVLGRRVAAGRLPGAKRGADSPFWGRLAATVMRRPALTALPVLAVLLLAASPLLGVTFGTPDERVLPPDAQSRQVSETLDREFPQGDRDAIRVVTTGPVERQALGRYARELAALPGVARVSASSGTYTDGAARPAGPAETALGRPGAQQLAVVHELEPKSDGAQDLVRAVRAVRAPAGTEALVGGEDARLVDSKRAIGDRLPLAVGLVAVTTFVLLFLFTGSVVQPLRALLLNALSLAAAMGAMVWVFQDGHLSSVLGFTPTPVDTSMTVLLFCIAFGLSMDYEVFLTSRIKELRDADPAADPAVSVTLGLARTGRIVSMAAGLLAVSFFAFGTGDVSFIQMFGLGSGLAIIVDAVAVRGVLVPAAMRLLGRHAWYAPAPLRRFHSRFGLAEAGAERPAAGTRPLTGVRTG